MEGQFDERRAARDLQEYRKTGPDPTTQMLLDALKARSTDASSLLDIGGGVGVIQHELLETGVASATAVEVSSPYLTAARQESQRRGHADRVSFIQGDLVALTDQVPPADIVTLDRVICCDPDVHGLLDASLGKARSLYGVVYPRDRWWVRMGNAAANAQRWIRRDPFRTYVHPSQLVEQTISQHGFVRQSIQLTLVWQIAVYQRCSSETRLSGSVSSARRARE